MMQQTQTTNYNNTTSVDNEIMRLKNDDPKLTDLDLSKEDLSNNQIEALGEALANNTKLLKLRLNPKIITIQSQAGEDSPLKTFIIVFKNILINNNNTTLQQIYFSSNSSTEQDKISILNRNMIPQNLLNDWQVICILLSESNRKSRHSLKLLMNTANEHSETALMTACGLGLLPIVKQLIEHYVVNPNRSDDEDETETVTPLGAALGAAPGIFSTGPKSCRHEVVKYLLQQKCKPIIDINQCSDGRTPLMIACEEGDTNSIQLILSFPDIDIQKSYISSCDGLPYTALTAALVGYFDGLEQDNNEAMNNFQNIIRLLLEHYYTAQYFDSIKEGITIHVNLLDANQVLEPLSQKGGRHLGQLLRDFDELNNNIFTEVRAIYATKLINKNFAWGDSFLFFGASNQPVNRKTYTYDVGIDCVV